MGKWVRNSLIATGIVAALSFEGYQTFQINQIRSENASAAKTEYLNLLGEIERGELRYEARTREVANRHGLSLKDIDGAVIKGNKNIFEHYVHMISLGSVIKYEKNAREIARKYGFPESKITEALRESKERFENELYWLRNGYIDKENLIREIAVDGNHPTKLVDDALSVGRKVKTDRDRRMKEIYR